MKSTLFLVNIVLTTKVKKLQEEIKELHDRIQKYEVQGYSGNIAFNGELGKRKRKRKTKDQVERNYKCNIDNCVKSYGSENSLNQHMKLKHPEFWAKIKEKENILTASVNDKNKDDKVSTVINQTKEEGVKMEVKEEKVEVKVEIKDAVIKEETK